MYNTDDLYEVLQVSPTADPNVIRAAYKQLALKYHPDANISSEAAEMMKTVNLAYEVLGDPNRRREHDLARQRNEQTRTDQEQQTRNARTQQARREWEREEREREEREQARREREQAAQRERVRREERERLERQRQAQTARWKNVAAGGGTYWLIELSRTMSADPGWLLLLCSILVVFRTLLFDILRRTCTWAGVAGGAGMFVLAVLVQASLDAPSGSRSARRDGYDAVLERRFDWTM